MSKMFDHRVSQSFKDSVRNIVNKKETVDKENLNEGMFSGSKRKNLINKLNTKAQGAKTAGDIADYNSDVADRAGDKTEKNKQDFIRSFSYNKARRNIDRRKEVESGNIKPRLGLRKEDEEFETYETDNSEILTEEEFVSLFEETYGDDIISLIEEGFTDDEIVAMIVQDLETEETEETKNND